MPVPSPNIDPKESTEAKLCAYLEGELPPAERAEIEQHLAANPQHRQLLADLAKTRQWMRAIPQEPSPVDLAELFQGQAERSMLLDESHETSFTRWPQFLMVAAIVGLAAGLGVLVVAMLRGPGSAKDYSIAGNGGAGSPATLPAAAQSTVDLNTAPALPAPPVTPASVAGDDTSKQQDAANAPRTMATKRMASPKTDSTEAIKDRILRSGYVQTPDQKTIALVVSANSPAGTAEQLRGFFHRHQLVFTDTSDELHPIAVAGGKLQAPATQPAAAAIAANSPPNQSTQQNAQTEFTQAANENAAANKSQATGGALVTPQVTAASDGIFIARGVTPLQLELLATSLAMDSANSSVRRVTLNDGKPPVRVESVPAGAVTRGQTLSVTVEQLVGPGIEKTNVVKVTDDGTIALPMIDPVSAAGILPVDLQKRIADKYREANLIPQATVTVSVVTPPATQPVTQPATQPVVGATQPVAAPTADPGVDVVVLIEKSAGK
jgi:protein involved in polysaccharide export with SLBB domain